MTTNTYPYLLRTILANPAVVAALSYWQDDGFGTLIDTFDLYMNDENITCYLYAFIERADDLIHNPLFYGSH